MLDRLREKLQTPVCPLPVMLVSSPGFAILDSGCGKTIVGANTLQAFRQIWSDVGIAQPSVMAEDNHFCYGNGPVSYLRR